MRAHLTTLLREVHALVHDAGLGEYGYMNPDAAQAMTKIDENVKRLESFPKIVCLLGSTRFFPEFQKVNYQETMAGRIVLSIGFFPDVGAGEHGEHVGLSDGDKERVDQLHMRKVELADEVFIVNVDGYVGESTSREIRHALKLGRPMRWLEPQHADATLARIRDVVDP